MEVIRLIQHIIEPRHKLGNTLGLICTENLEAINVLHAFLGDYISDHRLARIELQIRKQQEKSQSTSNRNYRGLNQDNFMKEFNKSTSASMETLPAT